jgi:hypothetical protein
MLMLLDGNHAAPFFRNIEKTAKRKPSEYFERQVTIAASCMNSYEASLRHAIGVGNLMWGADFPHVEGPPGPDLRLRRSGAPADRRPRRPDDGRARRERLTQSQPSGSDSVTVPVA